MLHTKPAYHVRTICQGLSRPLQAALQDVRTLFQRVHPLLEPLQVRGPRKIHVLQKLAVPAGQIVGVLDVPTGLASAASLAS